jgi:hypothetical protein
LLDQQKAEFEQKEQRFNVRADKILEQLQQRKNEAVRQEEKATEILRTAEKAREEIQLKNDQLIKENGKLREELNAARQRAKRLAKKLQAEV